MNQYWETHSRNKLERGARQQNSAGRKKRDEKKCKKMTVNTVFALAELKRRRIKGKKKERQLMVGKKRRHNI